MPSLAHTTIGTVVAIVLTSFIQTGLDAVVH